MTPTFNAYTPLYHEELDSRGLAEGTRVWAADGNFVPVESLRVGDSVFGITYQIEPLWIPLEDARRPEDQIFKVWRSVLTQRQVLAIDTIEARAWQLTFGDSNKMLESRRLVAGGATRVQTLPRHDAPVSPRMVDLRTSIPNPRTGAYSRRATEIVELNGRLIEQPTPYTGMPCGDYAVVIPYEMYAGQTWMMDTAVRPFNRYLFTQAREVVPLMERATLYILRLQADTKPEFAASPDRPRVNVIAQTPFSPDRKTRSVLMDAMAAEISRVKDPVEFARQWDEWAKGYAGGGARTARVPSSIDTTMQGTFYGSQQGPQAEALERDWGIKGGWLNGGILVDLL